MWTVSSPPLRMRFSGTEIMISIFSPWRGAAWPRKNRSKNPGAPKSKPRPPKKILVVDAGEKVLGRKAGNSGTAARVVISVLLGIAQDGVSLSDFLEPFARAGLLVSVGMIFESKLPERVFNCLFVGVSRNAQDFVIVARIRQKTPPLFHRPPLSLASRNSASTTRAPAGPAGRASPVAAPMSGRGCGPGCGAWA